MKCILLFLMMVTVLCTHVVAQFTISAQQPLCHDSCNASAQVSAPPNHTYRYLWSTGDTLSSISNLCAGPYQCIISDSNGIALDTLSITIQQPAVLVIAPRTIKNNVCFGDTSAYVILNATGGTGTRYSFTWSTGYQGYLNNGDQFFLTPGNYSVTIADAHACAANTAFTITQPAPVVISPQITNTTTCNACDGSIMVTASGGSSSTYTYHWSTGSTSATVSNLCSGGYNISVSDTSGCMASTRVNVLPNQSTLTIPFSTATNIDCTHRTGFLFASPSGGRGPYHYLWSTGSNLPDIFNLHAGVYQVSVTDSLGCFAVATDTIKNIGLAVTAVLQQNFRCDINKGKIILGVSQGSPPYSLQWNNQATTDTLDGLRPGNYTVTVTDLQGCRDTATYNIAQNNNSLFAQTTGSNVTCANIHNGLAIVNTNGGLAPYNVLWNDSNHQSAIPRLRYL